MFFVTAGVKARRKKQNLSILMNAVLKREEMNINGFDGTAHHCVYSSNRALYKAVEQIPSTHYVWERSV